jgi:cobalt-zinc-cadmium efflux system protein
LASVLIGLLILWNAWVILRETIDILLESTPRDIEMSSMVRDLLQIEGVKGVHDLHVWSISKNFRFLSAHIVIDDVLISQAALIQLEIKEMIRINYGIGHCTLQLECEGCDPDSLYCDINHYHGHQHVDTHHTAR